MKKIVLVSALLASSAGWAQAPTSGQTSEAPDPNELVCRTVGSTESRLSRQRVCMTRQQWADTRRTTRENTERSQNNRGARQF